MPSVLALSQVYISLRMVSLFIFSEIISSRFPGVHRLHSFEKKIAKYYKISVENYYNYDEVSLKKRIILCQNNILLSSPLLSSLLVRAVSSRQKGGGQQQRTPGGAQRLQLLPTLYFSVSWGPTDNPIQGNKSKTNAFRRNFNLKRYKLKNLPSCRTVSCKQPKR